MGKGVVIEADGASRVDDNVTVDSFILSHGGGAYSTARTGRRRKGVVGLKKHCDRVCAALVARGALDGTAESEKERFGARVREVFGDAMRVGEELLCPRAEDELRVTVLAAEVDRVCALVEVLPHLEGWFAAEVWRGVRENAEVKDSKWVEKRASMKKRTNARVNEVVLEGVEDGLAYEGLSSNFFAVMKVNGETVVRTAPVGTVLNGTVRVLVLKACEKLGVKVVEECPSFERTEEWIGAFVTSTSRLVLGFEEMRFVDENEPEKDRRATLRFEPCEVIRQIGDLVRGMLDEETTVL